MVPFIILSLKVLVLPLLELKILFFNFGSQQFDDDVLISVLLDKHSEVGSLDHIVVL